jgi:two-component system, NarL family, sensor histidine kinase DevS
MAAEAHDVGASPDLPMWIDELPDGLVVCLPDGTITMVNERLATMSGYGSDELVGSNIDRLVPIDHRSTHAALRGTFVEAHVARPMGPGMNLSLQRADDTELPVEISLSPLTGDRSRGIVAIVRDVTERMRAEAALRTTAELLSLADERERIARDLHDTVLQRLFGLGLELQAVGIRSGNPDISARVEDAIDEIDLIIREIRTAVFTLGSASREGSLGQELSAVTSQAKRVLGFAPRLRLAGPVETAITREIRTELLASLREALTNIARHSGATEAEVELDADDHLVMRVLDNGRGIPDEFDTTSGNGLRNMAERARLLGGGCSLTARAERGTELRWWVPITH